MATKEKFEEAKRLYETANADQRYVLESLFPELKENEDERIRKEIIDYIKTGTYHKDWIAWLEKQVEQKAWTEEDKKMLKWVIGYLENKMLNTPISEERIACKNAIAWFKKLEGEQKPADKVELKFKVGDTVKDPYGDLYHITEIIDDSYKTDDGRFILFKNQEVYTLFNFTDWSEEDDRMCKAIIDNIKGICKEGYFVVNIGSDKLKENLRNYMYESKQNTTISL